jgi:hypothetical protein
MPVAVEKGKTGKALTSRLPSRWLDLPLTVLRAALVRL